MSGLIYQMMIWFPGTIHEDLWPQIPWREPIKIRLAGTGIERWACRLCIAERGLKAYEVEGLWEQEEEALAHVQSHGRDRPPGEAGV